MIIAGAGTSIPAARVSSSTRADAAPSDMGDAPEKLTTSSTAKSKKPRGVPIPVDWEDPPLTLDEQVSDAAAVVESPYDQTYNFDSSHVHVELSQAAVRKTVRRLLEYALLYDRTEGVTDPEDVRFEDLDGEPDLTKGLDMVVNIMEDVDVRRRRASKAVRVALWLPKLCKYLKSPSEALETLRYGGMGHPGEVELDVLLGRQLGYWLRSRGIICPRAVLDELIATFANLPGKPRRRGAARDAAGFRERVGNFLREKKVIALSPSTLDDILYVSNDRSRPAGFVKRQPQARALWAYRRPSDHKLGMYAQAVLYPKDPGEDALRGAAKAALAKIEAAPTSKPNLGPVRLEGAPGWTYDEERGRTRTPPRKPRV